MGIGNAGHGFQHHAVILIFGHFRNGQENKVVLLQPQRGTNRIPLCRVILEAFQFYPNALDIFQTFGVEMFFREFVVFTVDGDKHVREERCNPFCREKHQPIQQRSALIEVVAVGGINDFAAFFSSIPSSKPGEKGGYGGMTVNYVEVALVNNVL